MTIRKSRLWGAATCLALACSARGGEKPREFGGTRAFGYIEQQMRFGPRIPGTAGHERTGDWILQHLRATADSVVVQSITHVTRHGETLHLRNFFARFRPGAADRVLLLAHWDTRPHADQSQNLGQQRLPVPGANDGASGVAVLLGVADALKAKPPSSSRSSPSPVQSFDSRSRRPPRPHRATFASSNATPRPPARAA